jgi:hypothetical protein
LEYTWYIIDKSKEGQHALGSSSSYYVPDTIAKTKDLSYEVNLAEGRYTVVLMAKSKSTNYSVYKTASLEVATEFSRGFYILKETADGKTDLDMYSSSDVLLTNILAKTQGSALAGTPRNMSPCYLQNFVMGTQRTSANCISLTTNANELKFYRVSDMKEIMDKTTIGYETLDPTEQFYAAVRGYFTIQLFSNKGERYAYTSDASNGSGKFGAVSGYPGSTFLVTSGSSYGVIYWDETGHNLCSYDYNGSSALVDVPNGSSDKTSGLTDYTCISCGSSTVAGNEVNFFILKDKAGKRFLYEISGSFFGVSLDKVEEVNSDLNLAKSNLISYNGRDATLIYSVNNNKLYGYNYDSGTESELTLSGIPASEQITYISNQYWEGADDKDYNYNYFIVGTQAGDTYKLYMYKMTGGQPNGNPIKTITGTGKVKSVRYMTPVFNYNAFDYPIQD